MGRQPTAGGALRRGRAEPAGPRRPSPVQRTAASGGGCVQGEEGPRVCAGGRRDHTTRAMSRGGGRVVEGVGLTPLACVGLTRLARVSSEPPRPARVAAPPSTGTSTLSSSAPPPTNGPSSPRSERHTREVRHEEAHGHTTRYHRGREVGLARDDGGEDTTTRLSREVDDVRDFVLRHSRPVCAVGPRDQRRIIQSRGNTGRVQRRKVRQHRKRRTVAGRSRVRSVGGEWHPSADHPTHRQSDAPQRPSLPGAPTRA